MRSLLALVGAAISGTLAYAQPLDNLKKQEAQIFDKFRSYIIKRDFNFPQIHAMRKLPDDHYGEVFQIFCGPKGPKPSQAFSEDGKQHIWIFRFTVSPKGRYTVSPWIL